MLQLVVSLNIQVGSIPAVPDTHPEGVPSSPMGITVAGATVVQLKGELPGLAPQLLTTYENSQPL